MQRSQAYLSLIVSSLGSALIFTAPAQTQEVLPDRSVNTQVTSSDNRHFTIIQGQQF